MYHPIGNLGLCLRRAALLACALSVVSGAALAQTPDILPRVESGQIERYLQAPAAPRIPRNGPLVSG